MKRATLVLATTGVFLTFTGTTALADSHEGDGLGSASPVELYTCSYVEGKGPSDLDAAVEKWNDWADDQDITDYWAWTMVPFYSGPEQEFDVLWVGGAEKAAALGRAHDTWLAEGAAEQDTFNKVIPCDAHVNFAALQVKEAPERDDPANIVVSFADCNMADGVSFSDLAPSLVEWAEYREGHGSTSGMWVFFPAYGGGGEEFDFKFVASWQNLEDQGADYDQYNESGWMKANELFAGKVSCDSARVYVATNRRMVDDDE